MEMTLLHALILGFVQGVAEFLPISSSGHLILLPWILGWEEHGLAIDVALHVGTLGAVVVAFADDWWRLLTAGLRGLFTGRPFAEPHSRLLWLLAAASVPGAVAGVLLDKWAETVFRAPGVVAFNLAALGVVLLLADRRATGGGEVLSISLRDALLIGTAQALAVVPGVSRSGATISMGLFLGYRREEAARFSFLLATPIIFGAALLKVPHLLRGGGPQGPLLAGMAAAAVFGFLAIRVLLAWVRGRDYRPFAYYRFALAALVGVLLLVRAG
jgi:undecaprenyl-diphosphatase